MNDRPTGHDIDERGRAAAAAVIRAAEGRPIPELDPDALRVEPAVEARDRRWQVALGAAAALVVAAGAGVLLVRAGGDDRGDTPPAADEPAAEQPAIEQPLTPHIATDLPEGWELSGAIDLTDDSLPSTVAALDIYGSDVSAPLFGVALFRGESLGDRSGRRIDVGGRQGRVVETEDGGPTVLYVPIDDGALYLVSPAGDGLDAEELASVAVGAAVEGSDIVIQPDALPAGVRHLGTEPNLYTLSSPMLMDDMSAEDSHVAVYSPDREDPTALVQITTSRGDEARLHAVRLLAGGTQETTVGDRSVLLSDLSLGEPSARFQVQMVSWLDDGTLVRIYGVNLAKFELETIAEGVRPATDDEWADLLARTPRDMVEAESGTAVEGEWSTVVEVESGSTSVLPEEGSFESVPTGPPVRLGEGRFIDGTPWVLSVEDLGGGDDFLSLDVDVGDESSGSMESSAGGEEPAGELEVFGGETQTVVEVDGGESRSFAAGFVGPDVATVEMVGADGERTELPVVRARGHGAWVAELPDPMTADIELIAFDDAGRELGRHTIEPMSLGSGDEPFPAMVATAATEIESPPED